MSELHGCPSVSVVIPTLNSGSVLYACLDSIRGQRYPGELVEIIIADGGSCDDTVSIARSFGCTVVENPLKTAEAGLAAGIKASSGDLIARIDSDNILEGDDWLDTMTAPFKDPAIAATEPIRYTYRKQDPMLTRYCALLGMNDPLCLFLGNYDRESVLTGKWTGLDVVSRDMGDYLEIELTADRMPTIGANGFLVRKAWVDELEIGDYCFDVDFVSDIVKNGHDRFAKVRIGIIHLYGRDLRTFGRKQLRRVRDWWFFNSVGERSFEWGSSMRRGIPRFLLSCATFFPLAAQVVKGYRRVPDPAWLLHVPACYMTAFIYAFGVLEGRLRPRIHSRTGWRQ